MDDDNDEDEDDAFERYSCAAIIIQAPQRNGLGRPLLCSDQPPASLFATTGQCSHGLQKKIMRRTT
jgi:hypothetical protein